MEYTEILHEVKKSKFYAYLKEVSSTEEAKEFVELVSRNHKKSRHDCYAYIVDGQEKADDAGEPTGTAGLPILTALQQKDLNNHVLVVSRYFGGVKLGGGGLIRAYRKSAMLVIQEYRKEA